MPRSRILVPCRISTTVRSLFDGRDVSTERDEPCGQNGLRLVRSYHDDTTMFREWGVVARDGILNRKSKYFVNVVRHGGTNAKLSIVYIVTNQKNSDKWKEWNVGKNETFTIFLSVLDQKVVLIHLVRPI